jgi:hypothetical protein
MAASAVASPNPGDGEESEVDLDAFTETSALRPGPVGTAAGRKVDSSAPRVRRSDRADVLSSTTGGDLSGTMAPGSGTRGPGGAFVPVPDEGVGGEGAHR